MSRVKFLFFLFLLGLFLYYKGKPDPIGALKHDVYQIVGLNDKEKDPKSINENDTVAEDRKDGSSSKKEEGILYSPTSPDDGDFPPLDDYLPAKSAGEIVRHTAFILNYQEEYEQASWVLHRLLAKASGGKAPYIFDWLDLVGTNNSQNRNDLIAGVYSLIITDANGCVDTMTSVTVKDICNPVACSRGSAHSDAQI